MQKLLAVVLGGIADHAVDGLGRRTPLQVAKTPNLDHLAMLGGCGVFHPTFIGEPVTPEYSLYVMLGNPPELFPGRAAFEAIARDVSLEEGKVYFLIEPAFVDDGVLVEVRTFESDEEEELFYQFLCEHIAEVKRLDRGLYLSTSSEYVCCTHPGVAGGAVADYVPLSELAKLPERWPGNAKRTDKGLQPINRLLFFGCGRYVGPPKSKFPLDWIFYTDSTFFYGLIKWMGMECFFSQSREIRVWLSEAFTKAFKELRSRDGVFVYTDYIHRFGIRTRAWKRVEVIEEMDEAFSAVLDAVVKEDIMVMVASDVTVPSVGYKPYSGLPVPVMMMGEGVRRGASAKFDEALAPTGSLGILRGRELMLTLFSYMGYYSHTSS